MALAQTAKPPSPSSISPASRSRLAVATASPRNSVGVPVGSLRSTAESTLTLVSSPMMWNGRHIDPYQPGLVDQQAILLEAVARIFVVALKVTKTP